MNITNSNTNDATGVNAAMDHEGSEAALAAHDFAYQIRRDTAVRPAVRTDEDYEVRPCKSVRGHVLRLPVTGWAFWFPTVAEALDFAKRLAAIHPADCSVYDS